MLRFNQSNGRGDIVAQTSNTGALTWTASYEAYGKQTKETGTNNDRQRANSKEEDPTGLLNEGHRYRDLETGVWLSRDPAGFVDGPNLYAYVKQNPWTSFDPDGLMAQLALAPVPVIGEIAIVATVIAIGYEAWKLHKTNLPATKPSSEGFAGPETAKPNQTTTHP